MSIKIALAGNPNSGKTTLFNALTGANQFVGNWPGVTVEKKEGKLKSKKDVKIVDLPGIYSLSPYTLEEVVARNYLIEEKPDAILNIVDGTNLERNLYLTTQLMELGIPVVIAINMQDVLEKRGDKINVNELSRQLGCKIVEISALRDKGIKEATEAVIEAAESGKVVPKHSFSGTVEHALAHIEEAVIHDMPEEQQRWYSIKIFERDEKVLETLNIDPDVMSHIEQDIKAVEDEMDDDAESIITNERYVYIAEVLRGCYKKREAHKSTTSDKIDKIVTNRILALPIFAAIMFIVYYISVTTVGTWVTDWTNDGLFGDGFFLFGKGSSAYEQRVDSWASKDVFTKDLGVVLDQASKDKKVNQNAVEALKADYDDKDFGAFEEDYGSYAAELEENKEHRSYSVTNVLTKTGALDEEGEFATPDPSETKGSWWVNGVPVVVEKGLDAIHCADWLKGLILDGIVAGVGAVLGFVPQMFVLFLFLAFLESCGYMARVAFIMDRIFRKFGLSGKSFIPMLIGSGCGIPGIMASRTIENDRDRKMTIMTTTFIPCGAKLPIIALIAAALFNNAGWVAPSAYFLGIAAIVISGIILKKTKLFAGDPAPFVIELPEYHLPTVGTVLRSMWERGWSFIKKAGTIILLSSILIWLGSVFGWTGGHFGFNLDMELSDSVLGHLGNALKFIFAPLGFGNSTATVATIMGLVAKEEVVGVFGILDFEGLTKLAGYSFLIFNLLCAPCFAAMGAIRREMNNWKWFGIAIGYQCLFAYVISLIVYQLGLLFTGAVNVVGLIVALILIVCLIYLLARKNKYASETTIVSK